MLAAQHHYKTNPKPVTMTKDSAKSTAKSSSQHPQAVNHHHQRTVASHFATQDNRQPHALQVNQKSLGQLSAGGMPQPYVSTSQTASKTAQGKARKSTSLKTGGQSTDHPQGVNDPLWQLNAQQQMSAQPPSQG